MTEQPLVEAISRRLDEAVIVVGADRTLRFANTAAQALLAAGAAPGRRIDEVAGDFRLTALVTRCLSEGVESDRELLDLGDDRHLVASAVPVDGRGGRPTAVVLVLRDDSRVRHLETVRRDFVANVSHELRTPVAAIQLLVETLQGGALADPRAASEFVDKIGLEVSHMGQMVSELLELSTIEAGRRPLRRQPVEVDGLIEAAERLRPLAEERQQSLEHAVAPGTAAVLGDAEALGQVLRNLVHNAIKFTPPGGRVRIEAGPHDQGRSVAIRVVDTGCGIAPDVLPRIFERFYKADRSRQRDGESSGLGLAIARHTVEAHGGAIEVTSEPQRGSIFTVVLPAAG